ncbi:probable mannosyltransferase required for complex glycosylation [Cephalotrichum gorgonifer]|uniref:Probable mannosyltransferase required for complex glycosylation n=1 Tax=Cephalotrichum gorgonifer TaxID=2041049 RepID=A0AAE8SQZ2_9PEZI|nr:probable mannosyltransferase required for complex glycosylation [Cephalotrichum gorgonifer]
MARPLGAVRLKKANPFCVALGGFIFIFVVFFLFSSPTSTSTPSAQSPHSASLKRSKAPPVTRYNLNNVTITPDPVANREAVLVLTPMSRFYQEYWDNLLKLSYPHDLITLGFILPKTKEGNAATAELQKRVVEVQKGPEGNRFAGIVILRQDFEPAITSQDESERHKMENQKARRSVMAKARNSLLFTTLGPLTSWVLWLDADIIETPPTLIQDLASHNKPVLVPNCFQRYVDSDTGKPGERPYDYNNWQDSETAQKLAAKMGPDEILLEGYAEMGTYRPLMAFMETEKGGLHDEVPVDGVGGAALLVKADVHRDGAMFPPFAFYHLIETEGFAKMASRLGWQAYGLPNYRVYHYNE